MQQLGTGSSGLIDVMDLLAVETTERFFKNADVAHVALQLYENQLATKVFETPDVVCRAMQIYQSPERLTEAQRGCFLKAWCRLHTLASLPIDILPYNILASLDRLDFEQMRDVLRWLRIEPPRKRMTRDGLCTRHSDLVGGQGSYRHGALVKSHITGKQWRELEGRLNSLLKELPRGLSRLSSFWKFILHELYLDNEESGKGDSLADKLPPMDKQDKSHQFIDSIHGLIFRDAK